MGKRELKYGRIQEVSLNGIRLDYLHKVILNVLQVISQKYGLNL